MAQVYTTVMNGIICPHCNKAFKIDETGYAHFFKADSRHEHKELEGEGGKLKILLDSASARITGSQTVIKTLDVERSTGGLQT